MVGMCNRKLKSNLPSLPSQVTAEFLKQRTRKIGGDKMEKKRCRSVSGRQFMAVVDQLAALIDEAISAPKVNLLRRNLSLAL